MQNLNTLGVRALADAEIRAISFGQVRLPDAQPSGDWRALKGTLGDPATFGPRKSWRCACGKLSIEPGALKLICDVCGAVAHDARRLRRRRFGHIQLFREIPHPLFTDSRISVVPVLPIAFRRSTGITAGLNALYAAVLRANAACDNGVERQVARLYSHEWIDGAVRPPRPLSILMCLRVSSGVAAREMIFLHGLGAALEVAEPFREADRRNHGES